jgi:hypothetical protein
VRDQVVKPSLFKHEMHVARAVGVTPKRFQKLTHGTVVRNGIRHWHNGLEPKHAVRVALHDHSAVRTISFCVLHVIEAFAVRLPNVNLDVVDGLAVGIFDGAENETRLAVGVMADAAAITLQLGFVGVKRAEHCAFGTRGRLWMVNAVDEERKPNDVGQQDEFLAYVAADLADAREELDGGHPFVCAEACLSRKVVHV